MKIIECVQLSPCWWEARRGKPSASNFGRIMTPKTMKLSASADDYACELVADIIRLDPPILTEQPMSAAMRNGVQCEPEARNFYAFDTGHPVLQVGLCVTDDDRFCCSPDGLVGEKGGLELKCPEPKTHVAYLLAREVPTEYRCQVHGALIVTGRDWWDFMSYCPGFKPLVVRVVPDEFTKSLRICLETFWARFQEIKALIQAA